MDAEPHDAIAIRSSGAKPRRAHKKAKTGCADCRKRRVKVSGSECGGVSQLQLFVPGQLTPDSVARRSLRVVRVVVEGSSANTRPKPHPCLRRTHRPPTRLPHIHLQHSRWPITTTFLQFPV